ncbi:uncharacterized protein BJX67DRAFT_354537 [Aspergillus lucknowensis]|uniref:F-box domain-containing protein n=1 Tax=Aspergillus lucknowensis TaxID=176173 RepID=A0ABR4LQ68_9EURO
MAAFSSLPPEILSQISEHLTAPANKASLHAFSLANKRCHAASKVAFREIHIAVKTREGLETDIAKWSALLRSRNAFAEVRRLTISGRIRSQHEEKEGISVCEDLLEDLDAGAEREEDELTRLGGYYDSILRGPFYQLGVAEEMSERAWRSTARFLRKLTGLRDLVFACERRVPESLLRSLHRDLPRCRLHVMAFGPPRLLDFEEDDDEAGEARESSEDEDSDNEDGWIDQYDYTLATSPSLSTVVVPVAYDDVHREYNETAVQAMARGLAPNLKHVHIVDSGPGFKYRVMPENSAGKVYIRDKLEHDRGRGEIETLSLDPATLIRFEAWGKTVLFSCLRCLQLWRVKTEVLARAAQYDFSSLKSVALEVWIYGNPTHLHGLDAATAAFLESVPPLEALHLTGPFSIKTFEGVLDHHGSSVHKLSLYPSENYQQTQFILTPSRIKEIGEYCPNLRDLRLQVKRSMGDAEEQEIYRALGRIPSLRRLSLQLDVHHAANTRPLRMSPDDRLRNIFINMAVDAQLAREIFSLITRPFGVETLRLDLGLDLEPTLVMAALCMRRQWECSRNSAYSDSPDGSEIVVREVGAQKRIRREKKTGWNEPAGFMHVVNRIWPPKTGDWKRDWHSFPLQHSLTE